MKSEKDETVITLTEDQLERIIKSAIKEAMNELKQEQDLPGNEVDEEEKTPASFSLLRNIASYLLVIAIIFFGLLIVVCIKEIINIRAIIIPIIMIIDCIIVIWGSVSIIKEMFKTKRLDVLNTIFSAIMALSTLTVTIISAFFAYQAIGGGAA